MAESIRPHSQFLPYLLNRVVSQINSPMQRHLRKRGMTLTHWRVLGFLRERDGLIISELADHTVTDQATLSRALDRLEERGWIERVVALSDSRQFEVHLTAAGRDQYEALAEHGQAVEAWALRKLSAQETNQLRETLDRISDSMRISSPSLSPTLSPSLSASSSPSPGAAVE